MKKGLEGKVAIVTGGARGIGYGICERLAADGATVVMADVLAQTGESAATLAGAGGRVVGMRVDLADEAAAVGFIAQVLAEHGRIDILVNNAGISPKNQGSKFLIEDTSLENWRNVMAVNLTAPFLLCRECIPIMRRAGGGRIVNIISQAARTRPEATSGHYAASKAGLLGLSRSLAGELGPDGITVNCVAPGVIETPLMATFSEERRAGLVSRVPLRKMGKPSDIAAAVSFLVSDDAHYLTGTTIDVNGGMFMT